MNNKLYAIALAVVDTTTVAFAKYEDVYEAAGAGLALAVLKNPGKSVRVYNFLQMLLSVVGILRRPNEEEMDRVAEIGRDFLGKALCVPPLNAGDNRVYDVNDGPFEVSRPHLLFVCTDQSVSVLHTGLGQLERLQKAEGRLRALLEGRAKCSTDTDWVSITAESLPAYVHQDGYKAVFVALSEQKLPNLDMIAVGEAVRLYADKLKEYSDRGLDGLMAARRAVEKESELSLDVLDRALGAYRRASTQ